MISARWELWWSLLERSLAEWTGGSKSVVKEECGKYWEWREYEAGREGVLPE